MHCYNPNCQYIEVIVNDIEGSFFMTNEDILKKAIEKAKKNGWSVYKNKELPHIGNENLAWDIVRHPGQERVLIFSHDFAKAFWGHKELCISCEEPVEVERFGDFPKQWEEYYCGCENHEVDFVPETQSAWAFRLQQMVLEPEPLKYLEQFLEEDK